MFQFLHILLEARLITTGYEQSAQQNPAIWLKLKETCNFGLDVPSSSPGVSAKTEAVPPPTAEFSKK